MPPRPRKSLSGRATALLLACVLGAALLVTASPAKAENHMPWDQPGTTWQGTLTTSIDHTYSDVYGGRVTNHEEASYSDLSSLDPTADGNYDAHLVASGTQEDYGPCYGREGIHHLRTYDWQLDTQGPNPIAGYAHKFGLTTDDDGNTFFALWYQTHIPFHVIHYCTGDGDDPPIEETYPAYNGISKLGFLDGSNPGYSSNPLPDLDPDPLRLVGSKTWSLGDPPVAGMMDDSITEYTLTATYDLTLVTVPPECDTWKEKSVTWKAITPFDWMPDRHWGDYKVTAKWCYDSNADYGEMLFIRSSGTVDGGPFGSFARAANFFGFETRWENQKCEPRCGDLSDEKVRQASVSRKMAFCFDFSVLLDKLRIKDWIKEKIRPGLKSKIKAFIEANGGASGPAFSEAALTWVDDIIVKVRGKVDDVSEKLRDRHVPGFLANWIEKQVEKPVNGILARWKGDVTEDLYMGAYEDTTADVATDLMLGPFVDRIFNIFRVCDGGDFLPFTGENYPGLLTLWEPEVTVTVMADGRARFDRFDIYKHPALDIRRR